MPRHVPPLRRLGRLAGRRPRLLVMVGVLLFAVALVVAPGTMDRLLLTRFESPGSESLRVGATLEQRFGIGNPHFNLLVTARNGTVDDPAVAAEGRALARELEAQDGVRDVESYWSRGSTPAMRGDDGTQALVIARLDGEVTQARARLGELSPRFTRATDVVQVQVGGGDEVFRQVAAQSREDFLRAELVAVPLAFVLLVFFYRRFAVAAITLGMGLFAIAATMALLRLPAYVTDVSTFAANFTLGMGLGLGIDYSLFVVNRFREELRAGRPVPAAVEEAVATAGRTVAFSGVTVAAALSCLLLFPFPFLRSFAYAGIAVVLTTVFAALVVLPAALALLGRRADRRRPTPAGTGWWHRIAERMMRRPVRYGVPALLVVLGLGAPALGLTFGLPDDRMLPEQTSSRVAQQQIRDNFSQEEMDAIRLLAADLPGVAGNGERIERYAADLSRVSGIAQVDALTGSYRGGERILAPNESAQRFADESSTWFSAVPTSAVLEEGDSGDVPALIERLNAVPAPAEVTVGGYPAELEDFRTALVDRMPVVAAVMIAVTFVILFLMTGSLLLPLKATVLNIASMAVMFGALVWIFQEGNLSGLLGFTATGSLEPTFPILMFCIAFGLSMDYEVFMMSRIKEEYDRTGDNVRAAISGIERSGPLITAAAAILALAFATYAVSGVVYLKMLGIGLALVIIVDATLVRGVLVPVFMRLAGRANWWLPRPLRAVYERFRISESAPREAVHPSPEPSPSAPVGR